MHVTVYNASLQYGNLKYRSVGLLVIEISL